MLLKRDVIVTGNQLTNATATTGQSGPQVDVTLDSAGGDEMLKTTRANLGKRMAVVFIEQRRETVVVDGKPVEREHQGRDGHQRRHASRASSATASRPPASP